MAGLPPIALGLVPPPPPAPLLAREHRAGAEELEVLDALQQAAAGDNPLNQGAIENYMAARRRLNQEGAPGVAFVFLRNLIAAGDQDPIGALINAQHLNV